MSCNISYQIAHCLTFVEEISLVEVYVVYFIEYNPTTHAKNHITDQSNLQFTWWQKW